MTQTAETDHPSPDFEDVDYDWVTIPPEDYHLSHLKEDVAAILRAHNALELAPVQNSGTSNSRAAITFPRNNQVWTTRRAIALFTHAGMVATEGDSDREVLIHGRITDLPDLREQDLLHVNDRGGPWRVTDADLESERKRGHKKQSCDAIRLEHATREDVNPYEIRRWNPDEQPDLYTRTKDTKADIKGEYRWKKYETVTRIARIGPARHYIREWMEGNREEVRDLIADVLSGYYRNYANVHLEGVDAATLAPLADKLATTDPRLTARECVIISSLYQMKADHLEANAEGMAGVDDEQAEINRQTAHQLRQTATESKPWNMTAVHPGEEPDSTSEDDGEDYEYECENCGQGFHNRFRFSKQSSMCEDPDTDYTCQGPPEDGE